MQPCHTCKHHYLAMGGEILCKSPLMEDRMRAFYSSMQGWGLPTYSRETTFQRSPEYSAFNNSMICGIDGRWWRRPDAPN